MILQELPSHILLLFSLAALLIGPLLFFVFRKSASLLSALDGFIVIAISGLVFLHILPHTVQEIGGWAFVIFLASLLLPSFLERMQSQLAEKTHTTTLVIALLGIALHTFTDGIAVSNAIPRHGFHGNMLPLAIILHRIPDGLAIWWLMRPQYGKGSASRVLALMFLATILGYFVGPVFFSHLEHHWVGVFEALVGGSLLHVIFHTHHPMTYQKQTTQSKTYAGVGACFALFIVSLLTSLTEYSHQSYLSQTVNTLYALAQESAFALVLAYLFSGILQSFFPTGSIRWLKKGSSFTQSIKGMAFGLPLPICSCGVIPIYRSLALKGVPLSACLAFFIATPELSLDAVLLSLPLLGTQFTMYRVLVAAFIAIALPTLISVFLLKKNQNTATSQQITEHEQEKNLSFTSSQQKNLKEKFKYALKQGFMESVDDTGPWIIFGILIAALIAPFLNPELFTKTLSSWLQVPIFALLGMPMYVCASGATPLVAVLIAGSLSPGAGLAFLMTGPATNATTFAVIQKFHGKKIALSFGIGMAVFSILSGYALNAVFAYETLPQIHAHEHTTWGYIQKIFLVILIGLFLFSLLRKGPRALINEIFSFENSHGHHQHTHGHEDEKSCCH